MRQRGPQDAGSMLPSSHSANRFQRRNHGGRFGTGCCYQLMVDVRRRNRVQFLLIVTFFTTLVRTTSSCASLAQGREEPDVATSSSSEQSTGGNRVRGRSHTGSESTRDATPNSVGRTLRSSSTNDAPAGPVAEAFLRTSGLSDLVGAPDDFTTDGTLNEVVDSLKGASADSGDNTVRASTTVRSRVPSTNSNDLTQEAVMSGYLEGTEEGLDRHPGVTAFSESAQSPSPSSSPCCLKPRASEALLREINEPQQRLECGHFFPSNDLQVQACGIENFPSCCQGVNGRHRDEQGPPAAAIAAAAPWGVPATLLDGEDVVAPVPVSAATTAVGHAPWESAIWAPGKEIPTTVSFASPGLREILEAFGWVGRGDFSSGLAVAKSETSPASSSPGVRVASSLPVPGSGELPPRLLWTPVNPEAGLLSASEGSGKSFTTAASEGARGRMTGSSIYRIGQTETGARFHNAVRRESDISPGDGLGGGVQHVQPSLRGHEEAWRFGKHSIPFQAADGGDGGSEKGDRAQAPHEYPALSTSALLRMHSDEPITFRTHAASEKENGNTGYSFRNVDSSVTPCGVAASFQATSTPLGDNPGAAYTASQFLWGAHTLPSMSSILRTELKGQSQLLSSTTHDDVSAPGARTPTARSDASHIPPCSQRSQGGFETCRPLGFSDSGINASLDPLGFPLRKPRYVVPELPPRFKKLRHLRDPATLWNEDYRIGTTGPRRIQAHHVRSPKDWSAPRTPSGSSMSVPSSQNTIAPRGLERSRHPAGGDTGTPRRAPLYSEVVRGIAGARACSAGGSLKSGVVVGKGTLPGPEPYDIGSQSRPLGSLPSVKKGHQLNPLAPEFQPRVTTPESGGTNRTSRDAIGSHGQAGTSEAQTPVLLATNQYTGGEGTSPSVGGSQYLLRASEFVSLPSPVRDAGPPKSRRPAHGLTHQQSALMDTLSLTTFFGGVLQTSAQQQQMRGRTVRQPLSSILGNPGFELRQESRTPGLVDHSCHPLHHKQVSGMVSPLSLVVQQARIFGFGASVPQLLQASHVALLVGIFSHVLQHPSSSWPGRFSRQFRSPTPSPRARSPRLERSGDRGATSPQSPELFGEESHRPPHLSSYGPKKPSAVEAKKEQQLLAQRLLQQQHVVPSPAESVTWQQDKDDGASSSPCGGTSNQEADVERLPSSEVGTPARPQRMPMQHRRSNASTRPVPRTSSVTLPAEGGTTVRRARRSATAPAVSSSRKPPRGKGRQRGCDPPRMPGDMCGGKGRSCGAGDHVTTLTEERTSHESGTNSGSDADTVASGLPLSATPVGPATVASAAADDAKSERASLEVGSASSDGDQIC